MTADQGKAQSMIRALEDVAAIVQRERGRMRARLQSDGPDRVARVTAALDQLAALTRDHGALAVEAARTAIDRRLLRPVDPSELAWDVFRMFEVEDSETAWTLWLASLLRPEPEHGVALAALVWGALCDAIVATAVEPTPSAASDELATLADWRAAAGAPPGPGGVERERAHQDYGRPDIMIDAPGLFVVLENKLDAGWHDSDEPQAVRYRKLGLARRERGRGQRLGLVVLVKPDDFELDDRCRDYVRVTYRAVAQALRRRLRRALPPDASVQAVLALCPALVTVAAIERDLLGLDVARWRRAPGTWQVLQPLNELLAHLPEEEER